MPFLFWLELKSDNQAWAAKTSQIPTDVCRVPRTEISVLV